MPNSSHGLENQLIDRSPLSYINAMRMTTPTARPSDISCISTIAPNSYVILKKLSPIVLI